MKGIEYTIIDGSNSLVMEKLSKMFISKNSLIYDITFGKGRFWEWDYSDYTVKGFDANHNHKCEKIDWFDIPKLNLPKADVVIFDPPFVIRPQKSDSVISKHFWHDYKMKTLFDKIQPIITELTNNLFILKIMDTLYAGKPNWYHFDAYNIFSKNFELEDMIIKKNNSVPISPNMMNQKHFRKNHSYFMIFKKKKGITLLTDSEGKK